MSRPDKSGLMNFGDTGEGLGISHFFYAIANALDHGLAQWFGDQIAVKHSPSIWDLLYYNPNLEPTPPDYMPTDRLFKSVHLASFRSNWEEKAIGPDRDNPNFIYPYRELNLKKPAKNAIEWAYDSYSHIVENGETLWTIAQKEYGDELAWVVLFWDNEDLLNSQDGKLLPGMKLKVRSELWPEVK